MQLDIYNAANHNAVHYKLPVIPVKQHLVKDYINTRGQVTLLWQRLRRPILEKAALTHTDKRILYGLHHTKSLTKRELARRLVLEDSSLTRSLARLEQRKLICRISSEQDKRCVLLQLTPTGHTLANQILADSTKLAQTLLGDISETDLQKALEVTQQFQAAMEKQLRQNTQSSKEEM